MPHRSELLGALPLICVPCNETSGDTLVNVGSGGATYDHRIVNGPSTSTLPGTPGTAGNDDAGAPIIADGAANRSVDLNNGGNGARIKTGTNPSSPYNAPVTEIEGATKVSYGVWYKNAAAVTGTRDLFATGNDNAGTIISLRRQSTSIWRVAIRSGAGYVEYDFDYSSKANFAWSTTDWKLYTVVVDFVANTITLYVNDGDGAANTISQSLTSGTAFATDGGGGYTAASQKGLSIGARDDNSFSSRGMVDEPFLLVGTAVAQADLAAYYNASIVENVALGGAATPTGDLTVVVEPTKLVGGAATPTGSLSIGQYQAAGGAATPTGDLEVAYRLNGSATPTGDLSIQQSLQKAVGGSATPTGDLTIQSASGVDLTASATPTGTLTIVFIPAAGSSVPPIIGRLPFPFGRRRR